MLQRFSCISFLFRLPCNDFTKVTYGFNTKLLKLLLQMCEEIQAMALTNL